MKKIIMLILFFFSTTNFASEGSFGTYSNARFNYQLRYPSFLIPQKESENGAGREFTGKNASLTVYGSFYPNLDSQKNQEKFIIEDEFNYEKNKLNLEGFNLGYTFLNKNEYVISGTGKDKIVYLKKIFVPQCGVHLYFWLYYPKDAQKQWDLLIPELSKSFRYSSEKCKGDYKVKE